ncbi:MAG: M15 family metallopeptidase [Halofilum sp. (in: g-proteobacteria)]
MDAFADQVTAIHRALGIPGDYAERRGLPLVPEPETLVEVSPGRTERRHWLEPWAAARWASMEAAAEGDGIRLVLVSGWRSVDYQRRLIERKLERGEAIEDVLRVNAAPGYSEHHGGRAVDLAVPGMAPLTEAFEDTDAFAWLTRNAGRFGFALSYPRDNAHGIVYEPWHWAIPADAAGA